MPVKLTREGQGGFSDHAPCNPTLCKPEKERAEPTPFRAIRAWTLRHVSHVTSHGSVFYGRGDIHDAMGGVRPQETVFYKLDEDT